MADLSDFIPQDVIDEAVVEGTAEGRLELAKDAAEYAKSIAPEETGAIRTKSG